MAQTDAGSFGHVAWVAAVGNGSVTVEEYNWSGNGSYHTRTVAASRFNYIHIKDIPQNGPFGNLDAVSAAGPGLATVGGWAADPSARTVSIAVHIYQDGVFVKALTADQQRDDVAAAYPGYGPSHGFSTTFATAAGRHAICIYGIDIGADGQNNQIGCRTYDVASGDPYGTLDAAAGSSRAGVVNLHGWAIDPNAPSAPLLIHVYIGGGAGTGGTFLTSLTANGYRPDVAAAYPGTESRHGYAIAKAVPVGTYPVCSYAINTGGGINNTLLGCITATVKPALTWKVPSVVGSRRVGADLRAVPGSWSPGPVRFNYQLLANGRAISRATGVLHRLTAADLGKSISVQVTGIGPKSYGTTARVSLSAGRILPGVFSAPTPRINGAPKVGKTLQAVTGTWSPRPMSLRFIWRADGKVIIGASGSTLKVSAAVVGTRITVSVTATLKGYSPLTRTSSPTGVVSR